MVSVTCLGSGCATLVPSREPLAGVPNFRIVDRHLCRGGQPNAAGLIALARLGVRTVVNLRLTLEQSKEEEETVRALGLNYVTIPMAPIGRPTHEAVERALAAIESARGPVFVHCERGSDRAGTVVACYRIRDDGWTSERALQEAKADGMLGVEWGMKQFVVDFGGGDARRAGLLPAAAVTP
jgi:uncharacterized protein (TIGR01244 family)